jgi:hypothetical protein
MTKTDFETLYLIFLLGLILAAISTALFDWVKRTDSKHTSKRANSKAVVQPEEIEQTHLVELESTEDKIMTKLIPVAMSDAMVSKPENNNILQSDYASRPLLGRSSSLLAKQN